MFVCTSVRTFGRASVRKASVRPSICLYSSPALHSSVHFAVSLRANVHVLLIFVGIRYSIHPHIMKLV